LGCGISFGFAEATERTRLKIGSLRRVLARALAPNDLQESQAALSQQTACCGNQSRDAQATLG
jgi:hypothetical protein